MKKHQATDAFIAFAESRIVVGQEIQASKLASVAKRWCDARFMCRPLLGRGMASALRARGWTSRRTATGVVWSFDAASAAVSDAVKSSADAEATQALR